MRNENNCNNDTTEIVMKHVYRISPGVILGMLLLVAPAEAEDRAWSRVADTGSIGVPVAAGLYSLYIGDRDGTRELVYSWGAAMAATWALKETVSSTRPNGEDQGFPSRHTVSAFSGASFVHYRYGLDKAWPAYAVGALVGYARIEDNKHHWEDVIAGAALANLTAWWLTSEYKPPVPVELSFQPSRKTLSFRTSFRF